MPGFKVIEFSMRISHFNVTRYACHSSQSPQRYGQILIRGAKNIGYQTKKTHKKRSRNCNRKMAIDWWESDRI